MWRGLSLTGVLALVLAVGCDDPNKPDKPSETGGAAKAPPITNRISIPDLVRKNLGITFAKVQRRDVRSTIRVPGRFELDPTARHHYHAALSGRAELLVKQYQGVKVGTPLYRLSSPQWRALQDTLASSVEAIRLSLKRSSGLQERYRVTGLHKQRLEAQAAIWELRVKQVEKLIAAGSSAEKSTDDPRSQLAAVYTSLAEVAEERAEIKLQQAVCASTVISYRRRMPLLYADATGTQAMPGSDKLDLALGKASSLLGVPVAQLRRNVGTNDKPLPYWRTIDRIEIRARQAGIVGQIGVTGGAWVEASELVLSTVDMRRLRFRAVGLQSDLRQLKDGLPVSVVPPRGGSQALRGALAGTLAIGLEADADQRTIDLLAKIEHDKRLAWARPGIAAEMEITVAGGGGAENAIPLSAVIRDGLSRVFFRRDPGNPDQVIRIDADLGADDGRWVVVESGVKTGDQVVLHGAYELMLSSSGSSRQGGHFHADGTFHKGKH